MLQAECSQGAIPRAREDREGDKRLIAPFNRRGAGYERQDPFDFVERCDVFLTPRGCHAHILFGGGEIVRVVGVERGTEARLARPFSGQAESAGIPF